MSQVEKQKPRFLNVQWWWCTRYRALNSLLSSHTYPAPSKNMSMVNS